MCLLITLALYRSIQKIEKRLLLRNRGIKTEIKSSKLFQQTLASLNSRYVVLLYVLKSSEVGQFTPVKAGLFHVSALFVVTQKLHHSLKQRESARFDCLVF